MVVSLCLSLLSLSWHSLFLLPATTYLNRRWYVTTSYAKPADSSVETTLRMAGVYQPMPKYAGKATTLMIAHPADGNSFTQSSSAKARMFALP